MRFLGFLCLLCGLLSAVLSGCSKPPVIEAPSPQASVDCSNSRSLPVADDPLAPGPWAVGAQTLSLPIQNGSSLRVEVWYPARPGSEQQGQPHQYDLSQFLPAQDADRLPAFALTQPCNCYRDLPLDTANGPYPVILFLHGAGTFRTASLSQVTHWASRGFVVMAADHPSVQWMDFKTNPLGYLFEKQKQQAVELISQLHDPSPPLQFLAGHIDTQRLGVVGHSSGGLAAASLGSVPGVRVIIPMAAGGVEAGAYLRSALVMGADEDKIARINGQQMGFSTSPKPKRFIALENAGHLAFTDLCQLVPKQGDLLSLMKQHDVSVPWYIESLGHDGCEQTQMPAQISSSIISYATTAAFEETLQCKPRAREKLAATRDLFPGVKEFKETLQPASTPVTAYNPSLSRSP